MAGLIGRYLSGNKFKQRRPLLLSEIVKGLPPEVPQKEAFDVLTKVGESFGVQPELLRLEDSISTLTGMDSWRLGRGQEIFEAWLRGLGVNRLPNDLKTIGDLIAAVASSQQKGDGDH
ncbi:hypothetical protein [Dyella sp.]|uniref:hypothetical protein n=1 Tax=Dyella sp. TaxID=1869338 RepID=UPI002ED6AAE9